MASPQEYFHGKRGFVSKKRFIRDKIIVSNNEKSRNKSVPFVPTKEDPISGRRIVDLQLLAKDLWCKICDDCLSLRNVISETINGLGIILKVQCVKCKTETDVSTSSYETKKQGVRKKFDVNLKIALGMLDAGIGPEQLNSLLTAVNIPAINKGLLKRYERRVGLAIEEVAKTSCKDMIELEKRLTNEEISSILHHSPPSTDSTTDVLQQTPDFSTSSRKRQAEESDADEQREKKVRLTMSYDMGWQTRGNGKTYNSLSGHGALIGHHSRKVLTYGTRIKYCRKCRDTKKDEVMNHDCRCNFKKSAKAMEADLAVDLATGCELFEEANVEIGTLIGDEDSSTMASIRALRPDIIKWSDLGHIKKGFSNALYRLQNKHKVLTSKVIVYLKQCFAYAVTQNKGDVAGLEKDLQNIPEHVFDHHRDCKAWCRHKDDPTAKFSSLPWGKPLQGDSLYSDIKACFSTYVQSVDKIAPCGSTQINESFNAVVASKAPKAKHYSASESLDFRVACAVNQTNIGTSYIVKVNEKLNLSPGVHTVKHRTKKDKSRNADKIRKALLATKKRRLQLRNRRKNQGKNQEIREGTTYQSGMGLLELSTVQILPREFMVKSTSQSSVYVYFDLETSGVSANSVVIQIAARYEKEIYEAYILPSFIPEKVSQITGLSKSGNTLLLNGQTVSTVSRRDAWHGLINFLTEIKDRIIFVGRNVCFDLRFLIKETNQLNLKGYVDVLLHGIIDTIKVCKAQFPGRASYKQEDIARDLNVAIGSAHNAVSDVLTLQAICDMVEPLNMKKFVTSYEEYLKKKDNAASLKILKRGLIPLKEIGMSAQMIGKIASAGISIDELISTFNDSKESGIRTMLSKVTKNPKVFSILVKFLAK